MTLADDGPTVYTVAQGFFFIKKSKDPEVNRIVKSVRHVGSQIYTTGETWTGPKGATWAKIDVERSPGEMGWALVEGPGFGVKGPLLVDPTTTGDGLQLIQIKYEKDAIFSMMMSTSGTVGQLIDRLCLRTNLKRKEVVLTKGLPAKAPNGSGIRLPADYVAPKDILFREMTIAEAHVTEPLILMYIGHFDEDYCPC